MESASITNKQRIMKTINNKECGCNLYSVGLYPGCGYYLSTYNVYAKHEEEALEYVLAFAEENDFVELFWTDDYIESKLCLTEEEKDEMFIYVEPTMTDSRAYPAYILSENLKIEKLA